MTRVLVTGTGGMGSHIVGRLIQNGIDCSFYGTGRQVAAIKEVVDLAKVPIHKGDILDLEMFRTAVKDSECNVIIHTAGPRATQTRANPSKGMRIHLVGTANVMETARREDVERVVYTSSSSVYLSTKKGESPSRPIVEDDSLVPMNRYVHRNLFCYRGLDARSPRNRLVRAFHVHNQDKGRKDFR